MVEEKIRHYKEYANMTAEEIIKEQRRKRREYIERIPEEKKKEYAERYKDKNIGMCDICGKEYRNIYQHNNTKMHKKNIEKNNTLFV
jgi:hypothetical protein